MATSEQFYCKLKDVERIYGKNNVLRWSDADNNEVLDEDRIDWALEQSNVIIDGRFTDGAYSSHMPFGTSEDEDVPPMVRLIAATLTGLLLFDTRRIHDAQEPTDQISQQRKNYDNWIGQIMKGQLRLRDSAGLAMETNSSTAPFNVNDETERCVPSELDF